MTVTAHTQTTHEYMPPAPMPDMGNTLVYIYGFIAVLVILLLRDYLDNAKNNKIIRNCTLWGLTY